MCPNGYIFTEMMIGGVKAMVCRVMTAAEYDQYQQSQKARDIRLGVLLGLCTCPSFLITITYRRMSKSLSPPMMQV